MIYGGCTKMTQFFVLLYEIEWHENRNFLRFVLFHGKKEIFR